MVELASNVVIKIDEARSVLPLKYSLGMQSDLYVHVGCGLVGCALARRRNRYPTNAVPLLRYNSSTVLILRSYWYVQWPGFEDRPARRQHIDLVLLALAPYGSRHKQRSHYALGGPRTECP